MSQNRSIRDFFKPPPAMKSVAVSTTTPAAASAFKVPSVPAIRSANVPRSSISTAPVISPTPESSDQRSYTSSLSTPPPSSDDFGQSTSQRQESESNSLPALSATASSERVINDSDEDDDSDSSLEELSAIFAARHSSSASRPRTSGDRPKTPPPRYQTRNKNFHVSPLPVLSRDRFDIKKLIAQKEADEAAEASSKRFKAMLEPEDDANFTIHGEKHSRFDHGAVIDSVVAETEDGAAQKVKQALSRTEATVADPRWYFFDTQTKTTKLERQPFPVKAVPESWRSVLVDPQVREQTFTFGFAEDMVTMGQLLPDELVMWMLDEVSVESNDPLRNSYLNVFRRCSEQLQRLLTPAMIERMFRSLGGTTKATTLAESAGPVQRLLEPYRKRNWDKLLSIIKFFGLASQTLNQTSRLYLICMLLRMSLDKMVLENVDIHDSVQHSIAQLCQYIPEDLWDSSCCEICKTLFECTQEPTFRLQTTKSISSTTPRCHDLRRRLAMVFFLNDLSYSAAHSHMLMKMDDLIDRLHDPLFDTRPSTKYRDLAALIYLLDIAVDDGKNISLDLTDPKTEDQYNDKVEELSTSIDSVISGINTGGAANISRVLAKSALILVSKRIVTTLRTKPKKKHHWFDRGDKKKTDDLSREKKVMAGFLKEKQKRVENSISIVGNGVRSEVITSE